MRTIATTAARSDGGDLSRACVARRRTGSGRPISAPSRKPAWSGRAPTGSPWSRFFAVPSGCQFPIPPSCPKTSDASARRWGASSPTTFSLPASPSRGSSSVDFVGLAARWLEDERNARAVAAAAGRAIPYALDLVPKAAIDEWVAIAARRGVEAVPAAPLASRGLSILWAQGAGQTLLDQGLDFVETTLAAPQGDDRQARGAKVLALDPQMGRRHDRRQGDQRADGTLREMRDPDHPWREQANALIEKLIDDLAHDPEMRAQGEALKQEILANPVFAEQARALWEELETALRDDLPRHAEAIVALARRPRPARSAGGSKRTPARRARINRRLRLLALRTVLPRRAEIGAYIAAVVDNWDTADARQPPRAASRQGPAIYPHQRHAGRRAGRAFDLHPVAGVSAGEGARSGVVGRATARIA